MAKMKRKKKRTHKEEGTDPSQKGPPRSFVWAHGPKRCLMRELCADVRAMMMPHTAAKLKVSRSNVLKDFVHVAGPLGVSHFVVLTATEKASYLKLCKSPRGPTVVLKVLEHALSSDIQAAQRHPRRPQSAFLQPPLVVLQGFGGEQHMKLTAVLFQNMFPAINVSRAKLTECQRVVLLSHNKEADTISLRHFCISVAPSGLTKGVKALVRGRKVPDLSGYTDVADFIERAGYASESDGEDAAASRVDTGGAGGAARSSRVRLHEIGPRLELQLIKVQEGLAEGRVLHHCYETRSAGAVAGEEAERAEAARAKAERRRQQEENVKRKAQEAARAAAAKQAEQERKEAKRRREDPAQGAVGGKLPKRSRGAKLQWWEADNPSSGVAAGGGGGAVGGKQHAQHEPDDDVQEYINEVGEAPDEHFGALPGSSAQAAKNARTAKPHQHKSGAVSKLGGKGKKTAQKGGTKKPAQKGAKPASKSGKGKPR